MLQTPLTLLLNSPDSWRITLVPSRSGTGVGLLRRGKGFRAKRLLPSSRFAMFATLNLTVITNASEAFSTRRALFWRIWMAISFLRKDITKTRSRQRFLPLFEAVAPKPCKFSLISRLSNASAPPYLKAMAALRFSAWRTICAVTTNNTWPDFSGYLEKSTRLLFRISSARLLLMISTT